MGHYVQAGDQTDSLEQAGDAVAEKVTIYDVAAKAGVSISTVSLAMNAPSRVTPATRDRIYAAADEIGFEPKSEAVARARRGVGRIGVLAPFSSYPSFHERLSGVLTAVRDLAIEIVLFDHESVAASPSPLLSSLPRSGDRLDGLIVMGMPLEQSVADRLRDSTMAIVLVDGTNDSFDSVYVDDENGGRLAANHLVERGYETFGFVGEAQRSHRYLSPSEKRLHGFRTRLEELGKSLPQENITLVRERGHPNGNDAALKLSLPAPAAIFAHTDSLAARVLRSARTHGIDVPRQLGIVGFDDMELAANLDLTSVRQPLRESGTVAVELLLQRLRDPATPEREVALKLQLIARASTSHETRGTP